MEDLISKGCPRNKSLILKFPTYDIVAQNLLSAFILGWFDGDGNIYYYEKQKKWRIQLVGTREFLEGVINTIGVAGYWTQRYPERNNNNWCFQVAVQSQVIKFLEFIYQDSQFCLGRKKLLADKCLADLKSRGQNTSA
jgi:phage pi2 protein 07